MAKPAFIYAFDNLSPLRFAELCGVWLGSKYKGFMLGGVGADGGIDGLVDSVLDEKYNSKDIVGVLKAEQLSVVGNDIILYPESSTIFQFKHMVVARAGGQTKAREKLLPMFKKKKNRNTEIATALLSSYDAINYILVTNIEINSLFRERFNTQCKKDFSNISHCQIMGLDEIEKWLLANKNIARMYFPTIFGPSKYDLKVRFFPLVLLAPFPDAKYWNISVSNIGEAFSYINKITMRINVDGTIQDETPNSFYDDEFEFIERHSAKIGTPLPPGRKQDFLLPYSVVDEFKAKGKEVLPIEVIVEDEIGNMYTTEFHNIFIKELLK